ncbi:MAG: glycogen synthase GlgA [Myxococcales bacterium]|nr:glycogen synthase GlgA [Myxococcales bacterium]
MKVLFASSECAPFAKVGGLGDVVGALPKALVSLGHDVRIVLPKYDQIDVSDFFRAEKPLGVPIGQDTIWCAVWEGRIPGTSVTVYLLENHEVFGGANIYQDEARGEWRGFKFGLLSRAVFALCRWLHWVPDIIHSHDWPTAWVPVMANGPEATFSRRIGHIMTIHNMSHQPRFPPKLLDTLGMGWTFFRSDGLEDFGEVNVFKAGLYHASMLTTVSPRYAHEIRGPEAGCGLDGVVEYRAADLVGILNGIDDTVWDPATDTFLPARYSAEDLSGKAICKAELERQLGLDAEARGPLIGMISRLTWQKGLDVLVPAVERILATGARMVVLGSGEPTWEQALDELARRNPGRLAVYIGFSEALAHLIEAGSDLYLMPSRFEPCGLNQLYSQRYGTLPIVHATGGLDDTVEQSDAQRYTGTGFKMYHLHPDALINAVRWAVDVYRHQPQLFAAMQLTSMNKKMSWAVAARRYEEVYRWALERRIV